MSNIINKIDDRRTMDGFGRELINQFVKNIQKTDASDTGALARSFSYRLHYGSDRLVDRITFSHLEYGMFLDMGVGNGVSLEDIGYQKIGARLLGRKIGQRRAKRWYYKKIHGQTIRLAEIVMETRGWNYTLEIADAIEKVGDVNIRV